MREIAASNPEKLDEMIMAVIDNAIRTGKAAEFREIADRLEGKVAQRLEITGDDGSPVRFQDVRNKLLDKLAG